MDERKDFPDRPWKIGEVATYLGISQRTVYDWMKDHGLPSRKVAGGSLRFIREEVDEWLREQPEAA